MPDTQPPERNHETVARVKRNVTQRLLALPDVVAVGIGQKVTGGRHTGEPAIKVFVRAKRPPAEVPPGEIIPPSIDGVLTDVVPGGDPVPLAEPVDAPGVLDLRKQTQDLESKRPIVGGTRVINEFSCIAGTGGCMLWDPANHEVGYMLTAFHVLKAPDITPIVKGTTRVGQATGEYSSTRCCSDIVGKFAGGAQTPTRDEALIKLDEKREWRAQIKEIGLVAGAHRVTPQDISVAGQPYKVAKRGERSKITGGKITALSVTTTDPPIDNLIVIEPNPNPAPNPNHRPVFFAISGDSGSALINSAREVVGLIWAGDTLGNAYAYHIDDVLQRLKDTDGVTVEVAHSTDPNEKHKVPGGSFRELPPEIAERIAADPAEQRAFTGTGTKAPVGASWFSDMVPSPTMVASVRADLAASATGRVLLDLWERHGGEARGLVERDRRVTVAWHRGGGSALAQLVLRLPGDPRRTLPETLSGRPLMECVDEIAAMIGRAGSPELRDALDRARAVLPDLAGRTYMEIIAALHASVAGTEELIVDG